MKKPKTVVITGAAGQIGYALVFRIASGQLLGADQPLVLHLLEVPQALAGLKGLAMELDDCAFPLLRKTVCTADANVAFADADCVFLVGARPRGPGMERKDLLSANAEIFAAQGRALSANVAKEARILVVGNPANTNALIAMANAPNLSPHQFSAMMRLDHHRTQAQLAIKTQHRNEDVRRVIIWGNHSTTQYPDIHHAHISGQPALDLVDEDWYQTEMIPCVQKRGAAVIQARGASSAASAAHAALCAMRDWCLGADDWTSMAVFGEGQYDVGKGLFYSYPTICKDGQYKLVEGLAINAFSRTMMVKTQAELTEERDAVKHLLP